MGSVSGCCNCCGKIDVNTEAEINTELMQTEEEPEMKWLNDLLIQTDSNDRNIDIILSVCKELLGENIISRIINPEQYKSAMIWSKLCHRCDIAYPPVSQLQIINDNNKFHELKYCIRHAVAAYPTSFITVLGLLPTNKMLHGLQSTSKLLKSCFDIDEKDIIINNCTNNLIADNIINKTHKPNFYLCVDHKRTTIILSIRGTASIYDTLTDVNAKPMKYTINGIHGYAHKGIFSAAQFVFNNTSKELMRLCSQYKDYTVYITGHSLGAGIASMLGLMYSNKNNSMIFQQLKKNKLRIYSFASPCIVSKEFIDKQLCNEFINTIVLTTDIVTRLSIGSIKKLNIRLDLIANCSNETIRNALTYATNDRTSETFLKNLKEVNAQNEEVELFPIGKILWFTPKVVMEGNLEERRKDLMGLAKDNKIKQQKKKTGKHNRNYYKGFDKLINIKNAMPIIGAKHKEKYTGSNYVLCDATKCKLDIFQEMVTDLPESLYSHLPNRYIWACDSEMIDQLNS